MVCACARLFMVACYQFTLAVTHFVQNLCLFQGKYWDTSLFVTL